MPGAQVVQAAQVLALHPAVPAQVQALPLQAVPALAPAHLGVAPAPAPALVQVQVLAQAHPPAAQAQVLHLQVAQVQALPLQAALAQVLLPAVQALVKKFK